MVCLLVTPTINQKALANEQIEETESEKNQIKGRRNREKLMSAEGENINREKLEEKAERK